MWGRPVLPLLLIIIIFVDLYCCTSLKCSVLLCFKSGAPSLLEGLRILKPFLAFEDGQIFRMPTWKSIFPQITFLENLSLA